MKRFAILLVTVAFPFVLDAQGVAEEMFERYAGKPGYTSVAIGSEFLNFVAALDKEDKELQDLSNKISSLKILVAKEQVDEFGKTLARGITREGYKEVMQANDEGGLVTFYARPKGDKFSNFILHVTNSDEEVMLAIAGNFTLSDLSKLGSSSKDDDNYISLLRKLESEK
jgi:hypothetical protein